MGGGIYFDQVWTKSGSPYHLRGKVRIANGTRVTVLPGVEILGHNQILLVSGELVVEGSDDKAVRFRQVNLAPGKSKRGVANLTGVDFRGGSLWSRMSSNGKTGVLNLRGSLVKDMPDVIYLDFPPTTCVIEGNTFIRSGGLSVGTNGVEVFIRNNLFFRHTSEAAIENWCRNPLVVAAEKSGTGKPEYFAQDMIVEHNTFFCPDQVALKLPPSYNDAQMNRAHHNYFGTADKDMVERMVLDKSDDLMINKKIVYEPFLEEPHPDTPQDDRMSCTHSDLA